MTRNANRRGRRLEATLALLAAALLALPGCVSQDDDEAAETVVRETVVEEDGREVVPEDDGYRIVVDGEDGTVEIDEGEIEVDVEGDDLDRHDEVPADATEPPGHARGRDKDGVDDDGGIGGSGGI